MNNRKQTFIGLKSYGDALKLLFSSKLGLFLLVPIALNVLFWFLLSAVQDVLHAYLEAYLQDALREYLLQFAWFAKVLSVGVWLINKLIFFVLYGYVCGYLILIFLSPILSIVSARAEYLHTGQRYDASFRQFMLDLLRGIVLVMRNGFIQFGLWLLATFFCILFFFVPVLGAIIVFCIQILLFCFTCYYYGFAFIDYALERRRYSISQTVSYMRQHKGLAIGNGVVFAFVLATPLCGSFLAGFVAIVSTVAATVAVVDVEAINK